MKSILWRIVLAGLALFPLSLRKLIVRLMLSSMSRISPSKREVAALLELHGQVEHELDEAIIGSGNGTHAKHRIMKYHEFFVSRLKPGEHVLDVGCGEGFVAASIARAGWKISGIDLVQENIDRAHERFGTLGIDFKRGDATKDLPAGQYDVIVLSNVLEHISDRRGFLRKLSSMYRPRCLLVRVPLFDRHWLPEMKKERGLDYYSDKTHQTEYTQDSFVNEISAAGMKAASITVRYGEIWAEVMLNA